MTSDGITRIMLTSWRAHGPDVPEDKNQNLYALPPVAPDEGGLHLDLTPFLLFDKAIIDTATLDRLDSERRPEFTRLRETIEVLGNLHLLQPENYSDILAQEREARAVQESIEHSLRDLGRVPREVLDSVAAWETIQRSFVPLFRKNWSAADSVSHGPRVLLTRDTHKVTKKQGKQLEKKLRQADRGEIQIDDDIRGIVQPYLAYVRSNLVLRNCFSGCPIYDWGDFDTFYRRAFLDIGVPEPIGLIERHLVDRVLDVELPDFRPEDPLQLDKVLRDPSIRAFREKIKEWAEAYRNGVDVNVEAECHAARKAIRNIHPGPTRQVLGWASRVARIAGLAPDAGMQLGLMAAEGVFDGLNNKLYRRQLREHEWLFFTTRLVDRATM
jgi:hypothetical protein